MPLSRGQAVDLIRSYEFAVSTRKIAKHLALSANLSIDNKPDTSLSSAASYLGGNPHLPPGSFWPTWDRTKAVQGVLPGYREQVSESGLITPDYIKELEAMLEQPIAPLPFIAQINLGDLQRTCPLPNLPHAGILQFFYDKQMHYHRFDPRQSSGFRVLYHPLGSEIVQTPPPTTLVPEHQCPGYAISFTPMWTIPHWFSDDMPINRDDEAEYYEYIDLVDELEEACRHGRSADGQLGGWAPLLQGDLRHGCQLQSHGIHPLAQFEDKPDKRIKALSSGKRDWKLLLHIDSVRELDWQWGDAGYIYFYAHEKESRAGDFSSACCRLQC